MTTPWFAGPFQPVFNVRAFGAMGDGSADDTSAITDAINAAQPNGVVLFPPGTYRVVPALTRTAIDGSTTIAFDILSDMHLMGMPGAVLKLADNQSTDASPKKLGIFFTSSAKSNVSFRGLVFDMNGANNKISPSRPTTYNNYEQAAIRVSGVSARIDDVVIEGCQFLNNAGANFVVTGEETTGGATLGKRWTVVDCYFNNNGMDSSDSTGVYAWSENVLVTGCTFSNDSTYRTVGLTGSQTAFEAHGAHHRFLGNTVINHERVAFVASNMTSDVTDIVIAENVCSPLQGYGVQFFAESGSSLIHEVSISGNTFGIDDTTYTGVPGRKTVIDLENHYQVTDVLISDNVARKISGTSTDSAFVVLYASDQDAGTHKNSRIVVRDNLVYGVRIATDIRTTHENGIGSVMIEDNTFVDLTSAGGETALGNYAGTLSTPEAAIDLLVVKGNTYVDSSGGATVVAVYLSGTITALQVGPQTYQGMASPPYSENALTLTTRRVWDGPALVSASVSDLTSGVAVPNNTAIAATLTANVTVGAPQAPSVGQRVTFLLLQDATGGRTVAWNAVFKKSWSNTGNTAGKRSSISFVFDGTSWIQDGAQSPYL